MKRIMVERVGQRFSNTFGTLYEVINYESATKVTIRFLDEYGFTVTTTWDCVIKGYPRNPYDRTITGVGYLGVNNNGEIQKAEGKAYRCWADMIYRCYDEKYLLKEPTYRNCTVCDRWHCFANFLEDIRTIQGYNDWVNNKGWEIDKDLLQKGLKYKIYSPQTCVFIPTSKNTKESAERANNMSKGVYLEKDGIKQYFTSKTKAAKFLGVSRIQDYHTIINGYKILYE